MKKGVVVVAALMCLFTTQAQWKSAGDKIKTKWTESMDVNLVLPEYPRPQMRRENWTNLNGWWEYAFTETQKMPKQRDGKILVPFSPQCSMPGTAT